MSGGDLGGLWRDLRVRLTSTRKALRNRNLALLLLVWGVWVTTDWALLISVSVLALELKGPAAVGLVGALRVLPAAVLSGPLSMLTDRWSRGRLLAVVYVGWAALAAGLAWCAAADVPLTALVGVVALGSGLGAVVKPTMQAIMSTLVGTPAQLVTANSAYATIEGLGTVLGPGICLAALAAIRPEGVFLVVAVLFAFAAVAAAAIRTPFRPVVPQAGARRDWLAPLRGFAVLVRRDLRLPVALIMGRPRCAACSPCSSYWWPRR